MPATRTALLSVVFPRAVLVSAHAVDAVAPEETALAWTIAA